MAEPKDPTDDQSGTDIGTGADNAPTTAIAYRQTARRLANRYLRKSEGLAGNGPHGVDVQGFIVWLANMRPEVAANTWRQYKAAAVFALTEAGFPGGADALRAIPSTGARRRGTRTSATKRKGFPSRDRDRVCKWLRARGTDTAFILEVWIVASASTGLRPCEWAAATFLDAHPETGAPALLVQNAKATHGRAHGPSRTLKLGTLTEKEIDVIRKHANFCRTIASQGPDEFHRLYSRAARLMAEASRALWPKRERHFTLYSLRHQFAANAKKVMTKQGVGAVMGHATDETAGHHYARATQGEGGSRGPLPEPSPAEVARVRQVTITPPSNSPRPTLAD